MDELINVRVAGVNNFKMNTMIGHNLRFDYTRNQISTDKNYIFDLKKKEVLVSRYLEVDELNLLSEIEQNKYLEERSKLKDYKNSLFEMYEKDRIEHNEKFKSRRKKNLDDTCGSWAEGIITFPKEFGDRYREGKLNIKDFVDCSIDASRNITKYLGAEIIGVQIHFDESTPHAHIIFKNFDDMGRSLTHNKNIKDKGLSLNDLQDIGAKSFSAKFGLKRGIPKELNGNKKYKKTKDFHNEKISELNKNLNLLKKDYEIEKNEFTKDIKFFENEKSLKLNEFNQFSKKIENEKSLKSNELNQIENNIKSILEKGQRAKTFIKRANEINTTKKSTRSVFVDKILKADKESRSFGLRSEKIFEEKLQKIFEDEGEVSFKSKHFQNEIVRLKEQLKDFKNFEENRKDLYNQLKDFEDRYNVLEIKNKDLETTTIQQQNTITKLEKEVLRLKPISKISDPGLEMEIEIEDR